MYIKKDIAIIKVADTMMNLLMYPFREQELGIGYEDLVALSEEKNTEVIFRFTEPFKQYGAEHFSFMDYRLADIQYSSDKYTVFTLTGSIDNLQIEYYPWENQFRMTEIPMVPTAPAIMKLSAQNIAIGETYSASDLENLPMVNSFFKQLQKYAEQHIPFVTDVTMGAKTYTMMSYSVSIASTPPMPWVDKTISGAFGAGSYEMEYEIILRDNKIISACFGFM